MLVVKFRKYGIRVLVILEQPGLIFSEPKKISAVFFPVLFINEEIQDFYENYLVYIDKIENVVISKNSKDYEKYLDLAKTKIELI